MLRLRYFKKFILPLSLSGAAVGAAGSGDLEFETGKKTRPGDLPLYGDPEGKSKQEAEAASELENQIAKVREEVWVWYDSVKGYREKVVEVVVTAKQHSEGLIESLRNDELPVPRSGAIAISGLAGFILGLRGGWFKRILYGSTCAGIMAAICYPKETKEVTQEALAEAKKYVLISYNFIYGVKPDNLKLPSPSDLLGSSVKVSKESEKKKDVNPSANTVSGEESSETSSAKKTPRQNDQSDPADKDLYTNRK